MVRPGHELDLLVLIGLALVATLVILHLRSILVWTAEVLAGLGLIALGVIIVVLTFLRGVAFGIWEGLTRRPQRKHRGSRTAPGGR